MAINNTWIVARYFNNSLTLKEVMVEVINHLTGTNTLRKEENRSLIFQRYDGIDHWSESTKKSRCSWCQSQKINSNTTYKCSKCNVHLHSTCMKNYHTKTQ